MNPCANRSAETAEPELLRLEAEVFDELLLDELVVEDEFLEDFEPDTSDELVPVLVEVVVVEATEEVVVEVAVIKASEAVVVDTTEDVVEATLEPARLEPPQFER